MIKLKSILKEIFEESNVGSLSNEYELDIELDGIHIPGLLRPEEMLKIQASLPYDIDKGYSERGQYGSTNRSEQGEGASVELFEAEIGDVSISTGENEEERQVDMRFLHPNQKKTIEDLVEDYVENNKSDIESKILDRWEGQ